jgi:hypothetical protein
MPDRLKAALADRYAIEREIGAGGMATVYLAHDLRHDVGSPERSPWPTRRRHMIIHGMSH